MGWCPRRYRAVSTLTRMVALVAVTIGIDARTVQARRERSECMRGPLVLELSTAEAALFLQVDLT
jgi:hypothetical protein